MSRVLKRNETDRRERQSGLGNQRVVNDDPYVAVNELISGRKIKLVDLFAGIGGFHFGVAAAAATRKMRVAPVLVSELEASCRLTYEVNHGCETEGDINKISLRDYKNIEADIVTAGFPCQPFSNSGRKLGLKDPRGRFYNRIEEIIRHFDAKSFILENVPGMTKNGGGHRMSVLADEPQLIGRTMQVLEKKLAKLSDYHVRWFEVDSSLLGSPQVRRRVYIVGVRKDLAELENLRYNQFFPQPFSPKPFISVADSRATDHHHLLLSDQQAANVRSFHE